jgi:hypothetical protein
VASDATSAGQLPIAVRGATPGDELSRLRHTSALNAQMLASLRALRERELLRSGEQAALLAAVTQQLQGQWAALLEHASASAPGADCGRAMELIEDLVDYTSAGAGSLTPERESIHLGRFLRQVALQASALRGSGISPAAIRIYERVPEWVSGDARRLYKVLLEVIGVSWDGGEKPLSLEISLNGDLAFEPALAAVAIVIAVRNAKPPASPRTVHVQPTAEAALRTALVERLCELLGISIRQEAGADGCNSCYITLPLETAEDPAQASELERAGAASTWTEVSAQSAPSTAAISGVEADSGEQGVIDFTYLDRQLGSLAQLVLARTAPAFLALADERLTTLVVAQEMEDLERMRYLAQAWKASAMSVGARSLAALLGSIEKQAAAGNVPGDGSIRQIKDVLERLRRALAALSPAPGTQA